MSNLNNIIKEYENKIADLEAKLLQDKLQNNGFTVEELQRTLKIERSNNEYLVSSHRNEIMSYEDTILSLKTEINNLKEGKVFTIGDIEDLVVKIYLAAKDGAGLDTTVTQTLEDYGFRTRK